MIHPRKHDFCAKNAGTLFVALLRAKSVGKEGVNPNFAFHEDILLDDDALRLVYTGTTRARAVEMHVLITESGKRILTPVY